jgi:hypothetical protein
MLSHYGAVREASKQIASAVESTVGAIRERRVEQEPAITDRMLGAIEESLRRFSTNGVRWTAKTLTDRGRGAQETKYGADFLGVLDVSLPDYKVKKGFLAQAKRAGHLNRKELTTLHDQCERMLKLTPESFVFVYSDVGIDVVPALAVLGSSKQPLEHYKRSAERFFESHLECFIGDREIAAPTPETLEGLRRRFEARVALRISAVQDDGPID